MQTHTHSDLWDTGTQTYWRQLSNRRRPRRQGWNDKRPTLTWTSSTPLHSQRLFSFTLLSSSRPPRRLTLLASSMCLTLVSVITVTWLNPRLIRLGHHLRAHTSHSELIKPVSLCRTPNRFCHKSNFSPLFSTQTCTPSHIVFFLHPFCEVTRYNFIMLDVRPKRGDGKIICNFRHVKNIELSSCGFVLLFPHYFPTFPVLLAVITLRTEDIIL